jgi:hypothetical protein
VKATLLVSGLVACVAEYIRYQGAQNCSQ